MFIFHLFIYIGGKKITLASKILNAFWAALLEITLYNQFRPLWHDKVQKRCCYHWPTLTSPLGLNFNGYCNVEEQLEKLGGKKDKDQKIEEVERGRISHSISKINWRGHYWLRTTFWGAQAPCAAELIYCNDFPQQAKDLQLRATWSFYLFLLTVTATCVPMKSVAHQASQRHLEP